MGEGKNSKQTYLLKLASLAEISKNKALEITDQVSTAVRQWKIFASEAGVSKQQTQYIDKTLETVIKNL